MICIFDFVRRVPAFYNVFRARLACPLAHIRHHCTRFNLDVLTPSMWDQLVRLVGFWGSTCGPLGEL